jgi:hypothetical protein
LYIRELGRQKQARAEQYVRNAPSRIQTKLRDVFRNELDWSANELPRILFAERWSEPPTRKVATFDISVYPCLCNENSIGGKRKVEEALDKYVKRILHK